MAKFLFFPYSNQLGTTIPSVTLANLLLEKGHEVIYASGGKYTEVLIKKGFKVVPINEISYVQYRKHVDNNNVDFYQRSLVEHFVDIELAMIKEINPDVIVSNNRPTIKISSQLAGKKLVTIVIPTLTKYYNYNYFIPENHLLNYLYPFGDANTIIPHSLTKMAFNLTMKHWAKNLNKVLKAYQLQPIENYLDVYDGDITLINQTYGLSPFKDLPAHYYFLEQNLGSTFGEQHPWANELDEHRKQGRKIIFVSMGSSSLKSYPLVMQAIKELVLNNSQYVLVSNHVGLMGGDKKADRIYLEPFINSAQILPKVDVVVTHGGINTMSECILNKKLIVGVPEQGEQMWNLKYAEHLGIGKMVSKFKLEKDPSLLTKALVEILSDDSYAKNMNEFVEKNIHSENNADRKEAIYNAIVKLIAA